MNRTSITLSLLLFCLSSCDRAPAPGPTRNAPGPTREAAVALLERFGQAVETGDLKAVNAYMRTLPGKSESWMLDHVAGRIAPNEFSRPGLEVLMEKGEWMQMTDKDLYFPKWKLEPKDCWRLHLRPAEVGFFWDGKGFQILRVDDISKLSRQ